MLFRKRKKRRVAMRYDSARFICDAPQRRDPTGTGRIQRRLQKAADVRFNKVKALVKDAVADQNLLGISAGAMTAAALAATIAGVTTLPGSGPDDRKVKGFQTWIDRVLLEQVVEHNGEWLRPAIAQAYTQGADRARKLAKTSVQSPHAIDAVDALTGLALIELQGIAEAVSQQAVRAVALGQLHRDKPRDIAKAVYDVVDRIGRARARAMIALVIVKAFNTASLDVYAAAGVKRVGLIPEFIPARPKIGDASIRGTGPGSRVSKSVVPSLRTVQRIRRAQKAVEALEMVNVLTAGDDDVCPICEEIEADGPYTIDEARSLIPAHPYCRCAFIPVDSEDED